MHKIVLIPGDGIGPEITSAVTQILESTGLTFDWKVFDETGLAAVAKGKNPLPDEVCEAILEYGNALKGPITTPVGGGFRSVNVTLRQVLDLYANVRPSFTLPGIESKFKDIDIVIFRENTEGLYAGLEEIAEDDSWAKAIGLVTRAGSERIIRYAFEYAQKNNRKSVTLVHKANILKKSSGMFLRIGQEIAQDYPDIMYQDRIIDNMCMQLVLYPQRYDCLVTTNLFGDIMSDLAASLVGGLGIVPGANIGEKSAVFEAVHGSAPDIAGQGKANPTALLNSAVMMLRHLNEFETADKVHQALKNVYIEGKYLTGDVGGTATTQDFTKRMIDEVQTLIAQN